MSHQVHIHLEYFAGARDLAGIHEEDVVLQSGATLLSDLSRLVSQRHPRLAPLLSRMRFARNSEFTQGDPTLCHGDVIAVLPPVAGGSGGSRDGQARVMLCDVRTSRLSVDEVMEAVEHPSAGGIAVFVGVVRDHADGKSVSRLDYESHPELAPKEMRRVLQVVAEDHAGVRLAAVHRVGTLAVGDRAVVLAASASHRGQAFDACRIAIDRIKETVPIWKREWDVEGKPHWVNLDEG